METATPTPPTDSDGRNRRPSVTQFLVIIVILALLVGGLGGALVFRGSDGASSATGEVFLESADQVGASPFTKSVAATPPRSLPTTTTTRPPTPANQIASVAGSTPGLYGGTRNATSCDRDKLVTFLVQHRDKAAAWAAVQGIRVGEIRAYIGSLTPVILLHDTRVTNHGFANGRATPHQSVLQAGTAVLVDRFGVPRARCFCGNPLTPPTPSPHPTPVGDPWPGYEPTAVVVVVVHVEVTVLVLVDVDTGVQFARPIGSSGDADVPVLENGDAGPGNGSTDTTTSTAVPDAPVAVASPAGTYTVQFSGEQLSPPCSPWGAGTGSMTVAITRTTIAITLKYEGGASKDYSGTYDPAALTFTAPDVQYGSNPLTGTFQKVDGVFTVPDGRSTGHTTTGGDCIGAFTATQTVG